MAQLTDLEKVRKNRARRRAIRNLFSLGVFCLIVFLCISLIREAGEVDLRTAYSDLKAEITASGTGYPVSLPGGKVAKIQAFGDTIALLTDTNLYTYNHSGSQLVNAQHGLASPVMKTSNGRILLYDRGGQRLSVYSKSALSAGISSDYTIYAADISDRGTFAVSTNSDEYLSQVFVYDGNGENIIFKWFSAEKPVIDVSLADNRDAMVVGCVDVSDGGYLSSITRFQFSIEQELEQAQIPGELLLSVDYFNSDTVFAVTDSRVVRLNGELREVASYPFEGSTLNQFLIRPDGGAVLLLGDYVETKQLSVVSLDSAMQRQGLYTIDFEPVSLKADQQYLFVAGQDSIAILSLDGTLLATAPVKGMAGMEPANGMLYYADSTQLAVLDLQGLLNAQIPETSSDAADTSSGDETSSDAADASGGDETSSDAADASGGDGTSLDGESSG